jgi:hypothetical protein
MYRRFYGHVSVRIRNFLSDSDQQSSIIVRDPDGQLIIDPIRTRSLAGHFCDH